MTIADKLREFYAGVCKDAESRVFTGVDMKYAARLLADAIRATDLPPELAAEIERDRKDAERYRWLRLHINDQWEYVFDNCGRNPLDNEELDRAIDAIAGKEAGQ